MYVKINNYPRNYSTYCLASALLSSFGWKKGETKIHLSLEDELNDCGNFREKIVDRLAQTTVFSLFARFLNWSSDKLHRDPKVIVHGYDTWNMDYTMAIIIIPMLKKFRDNIHSHPMFEEKDVPESIWNSTTDHFEMWKLIIDEMIFGFTVYLDDNVGVEYSEEEYKRADQGRLLFAKFYGHLWD